MTTATTSPTTVKAAYEKWRKYQDNWATAGNEQPPPVQWWQNLVDLCHVLEEQGPPKYRHKPAALVLLELMDFLQDTAAGTVNPHPLQEKERNDFELRMPRVMRAIKAFGAVVDEEPVPPHAQTIQEMLAIKGDYQTPMTHENIAMELGVDIARASRLIDGRDKLPENFVYPHQRRWFTEKKQDEADWNVVLHRWKFSRPPLWWEFDEANAADNWAPPPESVRDLIDQGVDNEQIARMHRISPEEVEKIRQGMVVSKAPEQPKPQQQQHGNHGKR